MQIKPEDRSKIIGLAIAIAVVFLIVLSQVPRLLSGGTSAAASVASATATAANPTASVGGTTQIAAIPASAANGNAMPQTGAGNAGQMRRFDDMLDTDAPVGPAETFGGHGDAFRLIAAPPTVASVPKPPTRTLPTIKPRPTASLVAGPILLPSGPQMVPAPPLEVVLDGVYQADGERVAQFTITGRNEKFKTDQVVYRRVGEAIGRFKIAHLTDTGLLLKGQARPWQVGETERLDEGLIPAPRTNYASSRPSTLPILSPHP